MGLQEVRWGGMEWTDLAQVVNACECSNKPSSSTRYGKFLD
jgi:hypothetical protein